MIRLADVGDFAAICGFIPMMRDRVLLPMNESKQRALIMKAIIEGRAYVADINGRIAGSYAFDVFQPDYSDERGVIDDWIVADQGGFVAGRLIKDLEARAAEMGLRCFIGFSGAYGDRNKAFERRWDRAAVIYGKG